MPACCLMLIGNGWEAVTNDDTKANPADSARYILRFAADGSVNARVDCNRAGGQYLIEEGKLRIKITYSTMAACEPDSLEAAFLKDIGRTGALHLQDGKLYIDMSHDTGAM